MKKITYFLIILLALPLLFTWSCSSKKCGCAKQPSFESSMAWHKLDGRLRLAWQEAMAQNDKERNLETLLKTQAPLSEEDKQALSEAGFEVRSVIKQIVSGSVQAKNVPAVAYLPIVETMELAVPMSIK